MLLQLLKNNRTPGIIFIFVLMVLLWLKLILHPVAPPSMVSMPLYDLLFSFLQNSNTALVIVSMLFHAIMLVILVRLNVIHYMLEERSYMPATFFLLISATFPEALLLNPILISSIFLILALMTLIRGDEHRADPMALFSSALLICAGSLFYMKLIWFIPFLWITTIIIRPLQWRGIVKPLLVIIMMALFYFTFYWVLKDDLSLLPELVKENLSVHGKRPTLTLPESILTGYLLIIIFITSFYMLNRFQAKKIIIRKIYQVLFSLFIYGMLFYLLLSGFQTAVLSLIAIPLAYLFANYFHRRRNHWAHEVLLWVWLLLIAYSQFA